MFATICLSLIEVASCWAEADDTIREIASTGTLTKTRNIERYFRYACDATDRSLCLLRDAVCQNPVAAEYRGEADQGAVLHAALTCFEWDDQRPAAFALCACRLTCWRIV